MSVFCVYSGFRKSVPFSPLNFVPRWQSVFARTVNGLEINQSPNQAGAQLLVLKSGNCALPKGYDGQTLQLVEESASKVHHILSSSEMIEKGKSCANSKAKHQMRHLDVTLDEEVENGLSSFTKITNTINYKEVQRRRKIGLANRGRPPWNKGRTHNQETRRLISKKTIEALRDPKVRKKMSEYSRPHSDQSKARISSALRKLWEDRLRHKRLQENCYFSWARSIAEAAKEGYSGQEKLQWDSYERMESEAISLYLHQKAENARKKENAKVRAEKSSKLRAENAVRLTQLRKEKEKRTKEREKKSSERKQFVDMKTKIALSKRKLKERLIKFHQHKKQFGTVINIRRETVVEPQAVLKSVDIDLIKIEKMRRKISLADQIQAVKNKKADFDSDLEEISIHLSSSRGEAANSLVYNMAIDPKAS